MMRIRIGVPLAALALAVAACSDSRHSVLPTSLTTRDQTVGTCQTPAQLNALAQTVFGGQRSNFNSMTAKINQVTRALARGDSVDAKVKAFDAVQFLLLRLGKTGLNGNSADINALVSGVFCIAGVTFNDPANSFLIYPTDQPQVKVGGDGLAGVALPGSPVSEPTLVTIVKITTPFAPGAGPLNTKLDQYPGFYDFVKQSPTNAPFTQPVVVGVCPATSVPDSIRQRLRLGHQARLGFEITPPADASFLNCPGPVASNLGTSVLRLLARAFAPRELHAASRLGGGGVGGSAGEFSPFAPVDPALSVSGGVGGSAGEFLLTPVPPVASGTATPSGSGPVRVVPFSTMRNLQVMPSQPGANILVAPTPDCSVAGAGADVTQACRPQVTIRTALGTPFVGVPVSWGVQAGGGTIAVQDPNTLACGAFGASAANATGTQGKAGVCWTTGATPGINQVVAVPGVGGDAVPGVTFSPSSQPFTVNTLLITPSVSATGGTFPYDGTAKLGSGTCSNALTPVLTYGGGSAPVNAGTVTVTVTCGAGIPGFATASATASITITPLPAMATAGSGTLTLGVSAATLPCVVSGLIPADAGAVTCATSTGPIPTIGSYATNAVVTPGSPANYDVTAVSGSVTFTPYVKSACYGAPLTATDSRAGGVAKGTAVSVSCVLSTSTGAQVPSASGNLLIEMVGTQTARLTPVVIRNVPGAFTPLGSAYVYALNTGDADIVAGRLYRLTTTWQDGSSTVGFLWVQP